jgi:hypothetical protein
MRRLGQRNGVQAGDNAGSTGKRHDQKIKKRNARR